MTPSLGIYICNSLVPEVSQLLHSGNYPDVKVKSFPAVCIGCSLTNKHIAEMIGNDLEEFSKIIVVVSSCRGQKNEAPPASKKVEIIQLEQCFEIFINRPTIYHFVQQGCYLVSNGWLRNYQRHIREWGFDKETAKKFFGETCKKILLIETGLPGDYRPNLEALSEHMGLPYEILPVGSSHLQAFLDQIIFNWRNEAERIKQNERIAKLTRESADFSLIFNQLKRLIDYTEEEMIVSEITSLLNMILAPGQISYRQFLNGKEMTATRPSDIQPAFNPENSLSINIEHRSELLGIFMVYSLRFPEYISHYKTIGQLISQIGGISIANARKYSELEKTRSELSKSENLFKAIMLQSPSVIELYDLNGLQINVNRAYEELWGFPANHTVNQFNILKSKEVKKTGLIDYVMRAYNGESVQVPEYQFNSTGKTEGRGKGCTRWLNTRIYPLKDHEGNVTNIIIAHEDVTLKKQAEIILSENTTKFKNLSQAGAEMLNLTSLEAIYDYFTEKLHQQYPNTIILFASVNEEENVSYLKIIKGLSSKMLQRSIKLAGFNYLDKPFKLQPFHKDVFKKGNFYHFDRGLAEFSGPEFPDAAAKIAEKIFGIRNIYTIGINKEEKLYAILHFFNRGKEPISDNEYIESFVKQTGIVIERKILEELLKKSEEQYRFIAENMSDVIWSIDIETLRFNYISPSVINLTGFTDEEAMQLSIEETLEEKSAQYVLTELPKRIVEFYEGKRLQQVSSHELQQHCKDGSIVWVEFITMFKTSDEGKVTSLVGISRNIDARKKAEIEIQQKNEELSRINAEKDKFFSIIAHDLRSPFASIVALTEMMADNTNPLTANDFLKYSKSLYKTASSTFNLLENLLEWSMLQRGITIFNPQPIYLNDFFNTSDEATLEIALKKNIKLVFPQNSSLTVWADQNMLRTIMRNLISNAIKFTQPGGTISVSTKKGNNSRVVFSIKDTGIGMSPEILNNLFRIDKNVSRPGTGGEPSSGLGLILCKEFVEKQGGDIWVESEEGKGSTFCFSIPLLIE
ncbi:MAG TPA: ATP-binding protein [Prolixibacteraceae bacterium]|nr:ATP-binding protein [Prolixibacteraceae bacterium]